MSEKDPPLSTPGGGDDLVFTGHTGPDEGKKDIVYGGDGIDSYNGFAGEFGGFEVSIADLNGLANQMRNLGVEGIEWSELMRAQQEDVPYAQSLVSDGLYSLALNWMIEKEGMRRELFTDEGVGAELAQESVDIAQQDVGNVSVENDGSGDVDIEEVDFLDF